MSGFNKRTKKRSSILHYRSHRLTKSEPNKTYFEVFLGINNDYMKTRMPVGNVSELKAKSKRNSQT